MPAQLYAGNLPARPARPRDARELQIVALGSLLAFNLATLDYGAHLLPSLVAIAASLATQLACSRLQRIAPDLRSPLITGLSLSLLLRGDGLWVMAAGAAAAIGSKFLLRIRGRHVWNPATFGIVAMLLTGHAWVSPGQWGASALLVALFGLLAMSVLARAGQLSTASLFLAAYAGLLLRRAHRLGDPLTIPAHQLESGALLLFAFFMITDPKTTPRSLPARAVFVAAVAALAHYLAFTCQCRSALYWSLFAAAPLVPLIDWLTSRTPSPKPTPALHGATS
ncbi:MAG: RnfABCDGE type electron transport complex subunit D [Nevskia sp.]|nr:RnfABCDGE type electron transport complex subunit D [Nevskia sp.]